MVIDIHTHAFPGALAARALESLTQRAAEFEEIYGPSRTYTDGTYEGLTASSAAAGIDVSVLMPIATSQKSAARLNEAAAAADGMAGLRSFGSVHPESPDAREELEHIRALGLRGIKLHPDYQDCYVDGEATVALVRRAAELDLWVLLHAGEDIGFVPPFHCTPERVLRLYEATGRPRLILAHMGGYRLWEEALRAFPPQENIYVDTSNTIYEFPDKWPVFAAMTREMGARRVLFGSDSPWAPQDEVLAATRRWMGEYGIGGADADAILGGNAQAVLSGGQP